MKVLIAGASGYIGCRLSSYLADAGFKVLALCNKNVPKDEGWKKKMHRILQADTSSSYEVQKLNIDNLDAIINLISLDHYESNGNPDHVNAVNVSSGWNLLDMFSGKGLKKYIYLSTIHVYGNQLIDEIDEGHVTRPGNKYALTHLLSEEIVNYYASNSDIKCTNIRLSNGYGAPCFITNKCWDLVVNNLCLGAWQNHKIVLKSDGTHLRDFIHLPDVLRGVEQLLLSLDLPKVINFSSAQTINMLDAAFMVKEVYETKYKKDANIFINGDELIEKHVKKDTYQYKINNEKFRALLGSQRLNILHDGINEIFEFLDSESNGKSPY